MSCPTKAGRRGGASRYWRFLARREACNAPGPWCDARRMGVPAGGWCAGRYRFAYLLCRSRWWTVPRAGKSARRNFECAGAVWAFGTRPAMWGRQVRRSGRSPWRKPFWKEQRAGLVRDWLRAWRPMRLAFGLALHDAAGPGRAPYSYAAPLCPVAAIGACRSVNKGQEQPALNLTQTTCANSLFFRIFRTSGLFYPLRKCSRLSCNKGQGAR